MKTKSHLLFLSLSTFNETGGIQNVCKTLCKVFTSLSVETGNTLLVMSLKDKKTDVCEKYIPSNLFKGYHQRKLSFAIMALLSGFKSNTIILGHIHLLFLVIPLKILRPRVKIILLVHGIEVWNHLPRWKTWLLNHSLHIWCVSRYTMETLVQRNHISRKKITILHNCLDPFFKVPLKFQKPDYLLRRYDLTPDQPLLLSLSRIGALEHAKGYELILNVLPALLNEFPGLVYLMGGRATADEVHRLRELIIKNGLVQQVTMIGYILESELTDHYLLADIFVLPSKKEGFGLVYIEAAACGCKIICGNQDGSTDAVLQGILGDLIDPSDIKELYKAIANNLRKANKNYFPSSERQRICVEHFSYVNYKHKIKTLLQYEY